MPQSVGMFVHLTSTPPSRTPGSAPGDTSQSGFNQALDSARQGAPNPTPQANQPEPTSKPQGTSEAKPAEKGQKSSKPKSTGPVRTKPSAKTTQVADAETDSSVDAKESSAPADAAADSDSADQHSPTSKHKDEGHAGQEPGQLLVQHPTVLPQAPVASKSQPQDTEKRDHGQPEEHEPLRAISPDEDGDGVTGQDSAAPEAAAPTPKQGGKPPVHHHEISGQDDAGVAGTSKPIPTSLKSVVDAVDVSTSDQVKTPAQADAAPPGGNSAPVSTPDSHSFADLLSAQAAGTATTPSQAHAPGVSATSHAPPAPREVDFAQANHGQIVTGIQGQLLPNGGSMQLHLHPDELGSMSISVHMRDGVMTATFDTSNDQATRLLTHSLGQLKTALESQGMSIGGLHVQQSSRGSQASPGDNGKGSESASQEQSAQQQERQRKEMLRRMWRRLNGGKDPLDMVA